MSQNDEPQRPPQPVDYSIIPDGTPMYVSQRTRDELAAKIQPGGPAGVIVPQDTPSHIQARIRHGLTMPARVGWQWYVDEWHAHVESRRRLNQWRAAALAAIATGAFAAIQLLIRINS